MFEFSDSRVSEVFDNYPEYAREDLLKIRNLVFTTEQELFPNTQLIESLKWNQPTYSIKQGTPIRLGLYEDNKFAIYFHCQTTMIEDLKVLYSDSLIFSKNRAIVMTNLDEDLLNILKHCIQIALTYHTNKKQAK